MSTTMEKLPITSDNKPDDHSECRRDAPASARLEALNAAMRAVDVETKQLHTVPALTTPREGRTSAT